MTRSPEGRARITRMTFFILIYGTNIMFARDYFPVLLTVPSAIICAIAMWRIRPPTVQVADMFWICCFFFFVVSPIQRIHDFQFGAPWERPLFSYSVHEFIIAELIVCASLVPFLFARMELSLPRNLSANGPGVPLLFFFAIASFAAFVVSEGGFGRVLASREIQMKTEGFIGSFLFLGILSVCTMLLVLQARRTRMITAISAAILSILFLLVVRNPFNAPRFTLVGVWLPVVFAFLSAGVPVAVLYVGTLVSLIVLFPILSLTTRFGVDALNQIGQIEIAKTFLNIPFFDLFDTLVHCVHYMEHRPFEFGQKTLAILLFFIPRDLWPSKPVVGGLDIGYDIYHAAQRGGTYNLSFYLGGDLYIDFGIIGVLIGFVLTAFILEKGCRARSGYVFSFPVVAVYILSALPILIRGPVGAVLPLIACQVFSVFFLKAIHTTAAAAVKR